jgi:hypothetical protein
VNLSRETRDQLWRELLKRSIAAPATRDTRVLTHWFASAVLTLLVLYLFAKL